MPLARTRDYLSIGEVLDAVRDDFPDVSVSKIRFLESEGLLRPERTSSGYRKFFDTDVQRLRYILTLQRDHFLPLKVIRERLADVEANGSLGDPIAAAGAAPAPARVGPASPGPAAPAAADLQSVQLTRAELSGAAGLDEAQLAALEDYGVLARRDRDVYDEHDLAIARAARGFFDYGIEPRHLRMYRQFAEREAAFIEQLVAPALQRKDQGATAEVKESLAQLLKLSRQIREGALRTSLRTPNGL